MRYDKRSVKNNELPSAIIIVSCVDTVDARYEIADTLKKLAKNYSGRNRVQYWMDLGNSRSSGQVILSTLEKIKQPASELYKPVESLPLVTDEFKELLYASEQTDNPQLVRLPKPSPNKTCSSIPHWPIGASLLWQLFREGILFNRGCFLKLQEFRTQPLKVA